MPPDLPATYYLDNVRILFRHTKALYADILESEYLGFIDNFDLLNEDAQRLLVRLLNRSGLFFRQTKISYAEIISIDQAAANLEKAGFIEINPRLDTSQTLSLFNKAELIQHHPDKAALKSLNRQDLENHLINENDDQFFGKLLENETILQICHQDIYQILQMIFFGNLNQSMTDFVLRDLGLYQYENYRIDSKSRPYQRAEDIQIHWLLYELETYLELIDQSNPELLTDCFDSIPDCSKLQSSLFRRADRLKFKIARQLERIGELELAMDLYPQCHLPPARERRARVYHQQKKIESAIKICRDIIHEPIDDAEFQFASEFASRLIRQNKLPPIEGIETEQNFRTEWVELSLPKHPSVEQAVVEYYQSQQADQQCFYLENSLFNSIFGLLIWDAIFAPVEGAFFNPFQYRPSDFYDDDFIKKRRRIFDDIWSSTGNNADIKNRITDCWKNKQGIANPLVDWHNVNLDIINLALQRIPYNHWLKLFERQLTDLRNNRAGFPDLIVFPPEQGYLLVEVKGPGDTLQKNQQRWMQYFAEHDIPHLLARVSWVEA